MNEQPFKISIDRDELKKRGLFLAAPMYGGQCMGSFARGVADLSALCVRWEIPLQIYYLFNESLITRARNYSVDEFMRSNMSHMMFIDSDIGFKADDVIGLLAMMSDDSPYDVLGAPYPKKSAHKDSMILTENGWQKIHDLVVNKFTGKVACLGHDGELVYRNVISHSRSPANGKKWVGIQARNQKMTKVTHDHEMCVIPDVLNPTAISWLPAEQCQGKYIARFPRKGVMTCNENVLFNNEQISFLIGTLLGDGSIDNKGYLKFGHSDAQIEYLQLKSELFNGRIHNKRVSGSYKGKTYYAYNMHCARNSQIDILRDVFYIDGKKSVRNVLDRIDEKALAFWYADDGTISDNGNGHHVIFCTESFDEDENEMLVEMLQNRFGIEAKVYRHRTASDSTKSRIRILARSQDKFFELISQYIIPSLEYKLPEKHRGSAKHQFNFRKLDISAKKVDVIDLGELDSDQYDIGVDEFHNFISDHYVLHNCISWEKVLLAANKGFGDKDPNNLAKYVGDFVFNPAHGTTSFSINQPVEVLETGTGFMMIKKSTFQKYQEAYPSYWYRPDHVRTANFDGTRFIMAYFDCAIDRGFGPDDVLRLMTKLANKEGSLEELSAEAAKLAEIQKSASMRYLSEDYNFVQNVRKAGMKVWLCPWIQLDHTGSYVFSGSLRDLAQLGASPTADVNQIRQIRERNKNQ